MIYLFLFIIGLAIGSFLNVVIYRSINDISVITPSSFCPKCKHPINWYDNIPVISYIILKGRCRHCGNKIDIQYPVVELLSGIITVLFYYKWGEINFYWFLISVLISYILIAVSVIDFKIMMLSDLFSYLIALLGIIGAYFNPMFDGDLYRKIASSISGIIAGAGIIYILIVVGKYIYKKDAVGDGDMFLMGALGAVVGVKGVFDIIVMASFFGAIYGVSLIMLKRIDRLSYIAFGPFLALACIIKMYNNFSILNYFL